MADARHINITVSVNGLGLGHAIADRVLEARLAASVQLVGPIVSHYWWRDERHEAREFLCLIKTTETHYEAIETIVTELHPYEVPELYATQIDRAPGPYRDWIDRTTNGGTI